MTVLKCGMIGSGGALSRGETTTARPYEPNRQLARQPLTQSLVPTAAAEPGIS